MVVGWLARRALARLATGSGTEGEGGRLVYVTREGDAWDLGAYRIEDLGSLADAFRVAYRGSTRRERDLIARHRALTLRLSTQAKALATRPESPTQATTKARR